MRWRLALTLLLAPPAVAQDTGSAPDPRFDADGDGSPDAEDCDDRDNTVYPGSPEYNDGKDNDCDGEQPPLYGCGATEYGAAWLLPLLIVGRRERRR